MECDIDVETDTDVDAEAEVDGDIDCDNDIELDKELDVDGGAETKIEVFTLVLKMAFRIHLISRHLFPVKYPIFPQFHSFPKSLTVN